MTPIGMPMQMAIVRAVTISNSVCGIRAPISSAIERWDVTE